MVDPTPAEEIDNRSHHSGQDDQRHEHQRVLPKELGVVIPRPCRPFHHGDHQLWPDPDHCSEASGPPNRAPPRQGTPGKDKNVRTKQEQRCRKTAGIALDIADPVPDAGVDNAATGGGAEVDHLDLPSDQRTDQRMPELVDIAATHLSEKHSGGKGGEESEQRRGIPQPATVPFRVPASLLAGC